MKNIFTLLLISIHLMVVGQEVTYYDANNSICDKKDAVEYTEEQIEGNQLVERHYSMEGEPQFVIYYDGNEVSGTAYAEYKDADGHTYLSKHMIDYSLEGEVVRYAANGDTLCVGTFRDNKPFDGEFIFGENSRRGMLFENGIMMEMWEYYENSDQVAIKKYFENSDGESKPKQLEFWDKDGSLLGKLTLHEDNTPQDGQEYTFYKGDGGWTSIESINHYKDGMLDGTMTYYDESGRLLRQQAYRNGVFFEGIESSRRSNTTVVDGEVTEYVAFQTDEKKDTLEYQIYFEGGSERYQYDITGKEIAHCTFKDDTPYQGTVLEGNYLSTYVDGELDGERIIYTDHKCIEVERIQTYRMGFLTKQISYSPLDDSELICTYSENNEIYDGKLYKDDFEPNIAYYEKGEKTKVLFIDPESKTVLKTDIYDHSFWPVTVIQRINGEEYTMYFEDFSAQDGKGLINNELVEVVDGYKQGSYELLQHNQSDRYDVLEKGQYKDDQKDGLITYYLEGMKPLTCVFKNGKPWNGIVYDDGVTSSYTHGMLNGFRTERYYDATIKTNYVDDKKDGISTFENDTLTVECIYKNDLPYTGTLFDRSSYSFRKYKEGKKEGLFIEKPMDNSFVITEMYSHGIPLWQKSIIKNNGGTFDQETMVFVHKPDSIVSEIEFKEGLPYHGTLVVLKNEEQSEIIPYKNGEIDGVKKTYQNGYRILESILISTETYADNLKEGVSQWNINANYSDEITNYTCTYAHGKPISGQSYSREGFITTISTYVNGKKHGIETTYKNASNPYELTYNHGEIIEGTSLDNLHARDSDFPLVHYYEKGVETYATLDIYRNETWVAFQDRGFSLETGPYLVGVVFSDNNRTSGKIIYKMNDEKYGEFAFENGSMTAGSLTYPQEDGTSDLDQQIKGDLMLTNYYLTPDKSLYYQTSMPTTMNEGTFTISSVLDLSFFLKNDSRNEIISFYLQDKKLCEMEIKETLYYRGILIESTQKESSDLRVSLWSNGKPIKEKEVKRSDLESTITELQKLDQE